MNHSRNIPLVVVQRDCKSNSPFGRNLAFLAAELNKQNKSLHVFVFGKVGVASLPDNVSYTVLRGPKFLSFLGLPQHWSSIYYFAQVLRRIRPIGALAHSIQLSAPLIIARYISGINFKILTQVHTFASEDIAQKNHRSWFFTKSLIRFVIKYSDSFAAVSQAVANDHKLFAKKSIHEIAVLYNPVINRELITTIDCAMIPHEWLDKPRQHYTLVHVGRFVPEKDHETLLNAINILRKEIPLRLLLIGYGPLRKIIETRILQLGLQHTIKIVGQQKNPYSFMYYADGLVLSSRFEGFGNVLIEAMALGCPVASTSFPGGAQEEILNRGAYGPIAEVGDACSLACAIKKMLLKPIERDRLKDRAMNFSAAAYLERISILFPALEIYTSSKNPECKDSG